MRAPPNRSLLSHEETDFETGLLIRQFNLLELDLSGQCISRETSIRFRIRLVVVDPFLQDAARSAHVLDRV